MFDAEDEFNVFIKLLFKAKPLLLMFVYSFLTLNETHTFSHFLHCLKIIQIELKDFNKNYFK